jgi:GT2 family glycosyltransferase
MPKLIYPEAILSQSLNFKLLELSDGEKGKRQYRFVHSSGRQIETDELGACIWKSLPAKAGDLQEVLLPYVDRLIQPEKNRKVETEKCPHVAQINPEAIKINPETILESPDKDFGETALETYLFVLYKAGLILIDGQAAFYQEEMEKLDESEGSVISTAGKHFYDFEKKDKMLAKKDVVSKEEKFSASRIDRNRKTEGIVERGKRGDDGERGFLISVVVVTHNGEKFIGSCLDSICQQTWPHIDIIVVDNASSDRTKEIIKKNFPHVRLYSFKRNQHFAKAVNLGMKKARGGAILVLNQDVKLEKDCLVQLVSRCQKEDMTSVGAVVPLIKFFDLRGFVNGLGNHIRPFSWGSDNFIGAVDVGQFRQVELVPSACFAAVLILRKALERVGYLDGAYGSFYEDIDWSFRCWLAGFKIVTCSQAIVYHHFGSSYEEGKKLYFVCRNRLRLVLKLFSTRMGLIFLKQYLLEDARALLAFSLKREWKRILVYFKAYLSLALSLPEIMWARQKFRKKRVKGRSEVDILALNPERWSFLNSSHEPVLNLNLIVDYYLKLRESFQLNG